MCDTIASGSAMIRAWFWHEILTGHLAPARSPRFTFRAQISRQMLRLPRKATLQHHQMLMQKCHSTMTKCCAWHDKWRSNITKWPAWYEKWRSSITNCCIPATKADIPTSPIVAPATRSEAAACACHKKYCWWCCVRCDVNDAVRCDMGDVSDVWCTSCLM